jgi:hypothetical protein
MDEVRELISFSALWTYQFVMSAFNLRGSFFVRLLAVALLAVTCLSSMVIGGGGGGWGGNAKFCGYVTVGQFIPVCPTLLLKMGGEVAAEFFITAVYTRVQNKAVSIGCRLLPLQKLFRFLPRF